MLGVPVAGQASNPGGSRNTPKSIHGTENRDECWMDGPLATNADFTSQYRRKDVSQSNYLFFPVLCQSNFNSLKLI